MVDFTGGVWRSLVDGEKVSAITDSVVSRSADTNTQTASSAEAGIQFTTSQTWPDFQAQISGNTNTASDEKMVIGDTNGNDVAVIDISSLTSGDVATFNGVDLQKNTSYSIYNRSSNARDYGYIETTSDFTSSDGNLSIISGWANSSTNFMYAIETIGNINL